MIQRTSIKLILLILLGLYMNVQTKTEIYKNTEGLKVFVFTKCNDFVHESRLAGRDAIKRLSEHYNFEAIFSEDSLDFNEEYLNRFDVVIWLSTSGNVLGSAEQHAFENYIKNGGSYVGIHGASATEYDWKWYGELVGAFFDEHPEQQNAIVNVVDSLHPSTKHLPKRWERYDEWYNLRSVLVDDAHVLLTVDETTYEGGKHPGYHPISWCRELPGGGRSWYTAMGHRSEHYSDENFLQHLLGGIIWAANGHK